jgi:hypothetical protein
MRLQFTVKLESRPEALAELLETLAARGVDLRSIGVTNIESQSAAVFTTNNDTLTQAALAEGGWTFFAGEVVITSVPDEPGALADVADRLACAGIGVHGIVVLRWHQGKAELALSVDDPAAARNALSIGSFSTTSRLPMMPRHSYWGSAKSA